MKTRLILLSLGVLLVGLCVCVALSSLGREPLETGTLAPAFALDSLSGETVFLSDLKGQVILLHFWSAT